VLVTAEVALAVMLVIGAGLLVRTVENLTRVDAGFDRSRMVTFSLTLPRSGTEADTRAARLQRLLDTLRQVPGVQAATAMSDPPFNRLAQRYQTGAQGTDVGPVATVEYYQFVMSDYFATMRIPIVAGRSFAAADTTSEAGSQSSTKHWRLWKDRDPIGQRLSPNLGASIGTSANRHRDRRGQGRQGGRVACEAGRVSLSSISRDRQSTTPHGGSPTRR
jgi:hypothetical protein